MFKILFALVIGVGAFYVHNTMYVHTLKSIDAQEKRRYQRVNLSSAELRANRKARKRRKTKLEKVALKPYGTIEKAKDLSRVETSCTFLLTGWSNGLAGSDVCGCVARGMGKRLNSKQVNFVYASAKHGGLRMLAGRHTPVNDCASHTDFRITR